MQQSLHSIFILEDNPNTCAMLEGAARVDPRLTVCGRAHTLQEAVRWLEAGEHADVALVDLDLPDGNGIDFIRACTARGETPCCIVMTVFGDEKHVLDAIEAGALGYLLKDRDSDHIVDSIWLTIDGGSPISPSIARQLLRRFHVGPDASEPKVRLTPREEDVLRMIVKGFSYREIADQLELSVHTVTSHIQHIYRKLAVSSRGEAVFEAIQLGLVKLS
ncbi:MAG: response regulator transcription factor [Pseudomonadota bacterium]